MSYSQINKYLFVYNDNFNFNYMQTNIYLSCVESSYFYLYPSLFFGVITYLFCCPTSYCKENLLQTVE